MKKKILKNDRMESRNYMDANVKLPTKMNFELL